MLAFFGILAAIVVTWFAWEIWIAPLIGEDEEL